jgi:hypothetical protein
MGTYLSKVLNIAKVLGIKLPGVGDSGEAKPQSQPPEEATNKA